MKTYSKFQLLDPARRLSEVPETSPASLLEPLFEIENPAILANTHTLTIEGEAQGVPKILLLGNRTGGVPLRVALFAGLDAGRLETVAAASRLLLQLAISPPLAEDYALFGYPIVNPAGFGPRKTSIAALQNRWAAKAESPDASYFRAEFRRTSHHGLITFRSTGLNAAFSATVRSKLIGEEVVAPALRAMESLVPVASNPVEILPLNVAARRADYATGRLMPNPETRPWPFEIELHAPANASADSRAQVLALATQEILRRYRRFIAQGGDL